MDSSDSSSLLPSSNPLHITVRFTTAIPDLLLDIPSPSDTTVVALKHLVRSKLDAATAKHRLRLIQSGKLLKDDDTLASTIKVPPPPPRAPDPKGKGKAVDEAVAFRVYINCSIGDPLTEAELSAEASAASNLSRGHKSKAKTDSGNATKSVAPAPRGFDRLLSGGFTAAEVNQLRLQFLSIQSNIHTPDTMPSPSTLRRMEDAWIDDNAGNAGAGEGGFDFGDEGLGGGALDDLLWGNLMGFLWPLGCIGWLIRERGVWSRRRQIAVFTGFMLSVTFGMLRVAS